MALVPAAIASAALFAMMTMTFADVVLRSALNAPIEAATELTRLLMAVVVFASMPVVSAGGKHIAVDLTDPLFSARLARWRDAAVNLGCGAMLFWPAERAVVLAERAASFGDVTEYLEIPKVYPAMFIAGACYVTAAALLIRGALCVVAPRALAAATPAAEA
ncbi:MAG: TRAP transporter small permease [Pseudomonadota bacterium]